MFKPYPQHQFYKFIINNLPQKKYASIIDGPCGYGYITSQVAANADVKQAVGVDLGTDQISHAQRVYGKGAKGNLDFEKIEIHQFLSTQDSFDAYLLVNSIFLLPEPEKLLKAIHSKLSSEGSLFVIIPNVHSKNFNNFQKIDPELNKLILTKEQAEKYFLDYGFKTEKIEPLTFSYFFGNKLLPFTWKFRNLYLGTTSAINKVLGRKSNYWGFVLSKK
ncbi:class I SAM-dependent methyltransferase [Chitinophagaceae bacterium 26-R-25]|nr:class I SAM-dependent methyltransferase [Chitinophagaceae bacterium 26-R-25]